MDFGDACRAAIEEISAFHPSGAFTFEATGSLGGEWDRIRIAQMLSNLLGNAVQHGFPDRPVAVEAIGSEDEVVVTVRNEGPPIPDELQKRIFEPLARGSQEDHAAKSGKNLGLGLYIACQIAKAHQGTLKLAASNRDGTLFMARLPRRPT
jgi:sigma-B regulation protein RsbU (phosphoserine phosphatase)